MKLTGGQIAVRALEDEDVPFVFGIPGTHNFEFYDALGVSPTVKAILTTHEQAASFMADAAWRASGKLCCVSLVPGAGLTHALSGIAEAYLDQIPLLVLSSGIREDLPFGYQLHEVDQKAIAAPLMKAVFHPPTIEALYETIRDACRIARQSPPGPVMVEVPTDQFLFRTAAPPRKRREAAPAVAPSNQDVTRAADVLTGATRPLIYVGHGAHEAVDEVVALAERLEAPVATTIQGKGVFPESHPLFLWPGFGRAAPGFVQRIVRRCDATLAVGCRFGEVATASYGAAPRQPLVHVDIDQAVIGRNYPAVVGIAADAGATLRPLLERLGQRPADPALRRRIHAGHARLRQLWDRPGRRGRVSPARLLHALQIQFGKETIFTADSGNGAFLSMECLRLDAPGRFLAPVDYSCMGYGVPAAVGAKFACPDTPVVGFIGDGAFLMTGLELVTAVRNRLPIAVFVLRDNELAQIAHFQDIALSRRSCAEIGEYDLSLFCRSIGVECVSLPADSRIEETVADVARRLKGGRPVVVDVAVDYSRKSFFTRGVMGTNLRRLPLPDRLRFIGRAGFRKVAG